MLAPLAIIGNGMAFAVLIRRVKQVNIIIINNIIIIIIIIYVYVIILLLLLLYYGNDVIIPANVFSDNVKP